MEKDLNDKLKQEKLSYFRSKEYRGEQLKVIMDAIDYGIAQIICSFLKTLLSRQG